MSSILRQRLEALGRRASAAFMIVFADGSEYRNRPEPPTFILRFRNRGAERRALLFGHVGMLDAYFAGTLDVDGDFNALFRIGMESGYDRQPNPLIRLRNHWHEWRHSNRTIARAKANARFHYGLGTDFYRLWLDDPLMMYTCAYWKDGTRTLEEAQRNKVEHVCRKIRLQPDETVIDIGCGFGGFLFHAVEHYAARATGLNTTTEQVDAVRDMVRARRLTDRISLREADFREVDRQYDKVVSIGVLEHAGRDQLRQVVQAHADFLKPGGLGMLHFIGHVGVRDTELYIRDYVFPGGWIPSLAEALTAMEASGLEVLDVENLRRHYALTLDVWAERFERRWPEIHAIDPRRFDERFRRIWRTYLISCAEMFRSPASSTCLFQVLFSKGNVSADGYPMSRAFLYSAGEAA
ncbi:cyclopropane-fatty-acyl-phospholipid synthase family protein [uncultured Thiohalocapsa sp.]|uniref:SAM-dependent methyltransferase n=1 Tax=uncultured Thiohalocapsa sp. TaxID=768990 RepID=UPI0025DB49E0|nr:cyclopropane-fatty-acyl-phospholipid synthase family protein [uncultured Thiohalocapsa sp.]